MQNVETKIVGDKLIITVDLTQPGTASASGKSLVVASTKGNKPIAGADGLVLGLNCYKAAPKA